jgi:hypothetical protein
MVLSKQLHVSRESSSIFRRTRGVDTDRTATTTLKDRLRSDGGTVSEGPIEEHPPLGEAKHTECDCNDLRGDFPCADCYIEGRKELPE